MTQDALRHTIVGTLDGFLRPRVGPVFEIAATTELADRDLVGGVVALRGTWWGVVIVRCDRELANALLDESTQPMSTDAVMRGLAMELAPVVARHLDPSAKLSAPVALAADNAEWQPSYAVLQLRVDVHAGPHLLVVEVQRRRRSDEIPVAEAPES